MHEYIELLVILGFLGTLMWGVMRFMLHDIHKDLINLKSGQEEIKLNMKLYKEKTDTRLDHLYEVIIEVLKTRK